ncbi:DUF6270 domain-containing protein [Nocardioides pantholopis]|uniref:DUF6270 domain-containing protein n=1 Tax=Nocardioides pantholopis TaxID=2483798 RepID=UPI000F096D4D|nr:DUF6270 domain-containing protein [Nocardioides pantholopis]
MRTAEPPVVASMGSCITRDNFNTRFNPDYKRYFSCALHQNQSSLIALMSPPVDVGWEPMRELSDYDRANIDAELSRSFLREVVAVRPDYLVLDFFADIHFGCVAFDAGRWLTNNRWNIHHTDLYQRLRDEDRLARFDIAHHTDDYLALWQESLDRFLALVRAQLPETTVVLHRGHNTNRLRLPDRAETVSLRKHRNLARLGVARANELWRELDDRAAPACDAVIDLTDLPTATYDDHPWGPFYVHYEPAYYHRFLAELVRIDLDRRLDADARERLALVETARTADAGRLAGEDAATIGRLRERTQRLQDRVAELEQAAGGRRRWPFSR